MRPELSQVYTDFSSLAALRARAGEDRAGALDAVSRQFESLFLQMMLKSMRDASPGGGLLDSKQTQFYRDMHDKQLAMGLSEQQGIGLAEVLKRQLGGGDQAAAAGRSVDDYIRMPIARPLTKAPQSPEVSESSQVEKPAVDAKLDGTPEAFMQAFWPAAEQAAARLQITPQALLAQAALETGWGRHIMRQADGRSSHNLFGIKADGRWQGGRVNVQTLEYQDGVAVKTRAGFRAYDSFAQSFNDYVDFVAGNPRYREALEKVADPHAYFDALQQAGYATDPAYADKVKRILDSDTMQQARNTARVAERRT